MEDVSIFSEPCSTSLGEDPASSQGQLTRSGGKGAGVTGSQCLDHPGLAYGVLLLCYESPKAQCPDMTTIADYFPVSLG